MDKSNQKSLKQYYQHMKLLSRISIFCNHLSIKTPLKINNNINIMKKIICLKRKKMSGFNKRCIKIDNTLTESSSNSMKI